jgi:hypothetical protein
MEAETMRTVLILTAGILLLAAAAIFSKLFTQHYPSAPTWAIYLFLVFWLVATGFNMWVGVSKAGYAFGEELPIMLLLFGVPAALAVFLKFKVL